MNIGIAGLGLIGGSMAKAVRAYTAHRVFGFDRDADTQARALEDGTLDGVLDEASVADCRLLLLALYPGAAIEFLEEHAARVGRGALAVDLCGVKRPVCEAGEALARRHGFRFVGGHPMAGRALSGYGASEAGLFQGASMLLTPGADTPPEVLAQLTAFFGALGFRAVHRTDPLEHDRLIAYTSQLAHVLSNAYVKRAMEPGHALFTGGSFQDLTRVARLNEDMWTELFMLNRDCLIEEVDALVGRLQAYADGLRAGDAERLRALLREGSEYKARLS
ncbi:prephenate dehydrogenase [Bacillota bacterium Meth-B3]